MLMLGNFRLQTLLLVCLANLLSPVSSLAKAWDQSLVRVTTYIQQPDIDASWRTLPVREETHMGIMLDSRHILVSAYAVAHSRNFEYQRIGASERFPLNLAFVDYNINLALLTSDSNQEFKGLRPIPIGEDLRLGDEASVYSARDGQRLIEFPLRLREVVVQSALFSPYQLPHYAFDIQKKAAGWSEPIIKNGRLVGITVSKREETVFAMPASVIQRFYQEALRENYRGLPRLGLTIESLTSPELRAFAKVPAGQQGVWVGYVQPKSAFYGAVQAKDVLVQVDEMQISDQGYYEHPLWGRISFIAALYRYKEGDTVQLKVVRDGKILTVSKQLTAYEPLEELIPWDVPRDEPYLIFGGLLFQELSQSYLKKWGRNWRERAPLFLLHLWNFQNFHRSEDEKRIVILNRVLADSINKGYEGLKNLQLSTVNDVPIHSLEQMSQVISSQAKNGDKDFIVFKFAPYQHQVIMSFEDLAAAHQRVAANYGVRDQVGFWKQVEQTATVVEP